jgi:very-short-patch-repair endonuclease
MARLSHKDAKKKCSELGLELLCSENEWKGNKYKKEGKTIMHKYKFKDPNGHEFFRSYEGVVHGKQLYCEACSKENKINSRRITYEKACENIRSFGCEPLFNKEDWNGVKSKNEDGTYITFNYWFKDKLGHKFYRSYDSVVNGKHVNCEQCTKNNVRETSLMKYDEVIDRIKLIGCEPLFREEEWEGTNNNYWFLDKNGHKFYRLFTDVASGRRTLCQECSRNNAKEKIRISKEEFQSRNDIILKRQGLKVLTKYDVFKGMNSKVKIRCEYCKREYDVNYTNIWARQDCCETCGNKISYPEAKFIAQLKSNGLIFEYQGKFDDLKYKDYLKIDFLSREAKIAIEIQSKLHDEYIEYFHRNIENFIVYQERDRLKKDYLIKNGYEVIYLDSSKYNYDEEIIGLMEKFKSNLKIERTNPIETTLIDVIKDFNAGREVVSYYANTGKFKMIYPNVKYASEFEGISTVQINDNIRNEIKHAHGLIFKEKKDYMETIEPIKNLRLANYKGITIENKQTKEKLYFSTSKEASEFLNLNKTLLSGYTTGRLKLPQKIDDNYNIYIGDKL